MADPWMARYPTLDMVFRGESPATDFFVESLTGRCHLVVKDLNLIGYAEAYTLQKQLSAKVLAGRSSDTLLLLEHPPVYTIGRGGNTENLLDSSTEVVRINRGGDITFHGPGQLVGYPIVNLARRGRDLSRYVRFLEEVLILTAADFGVDAYRVPGRPGVWTNLGKLASIGVGVKRWVTMHGFALNVSVDLSWFESINPCGMVGCPVTSLEKEGKLSVALPEVKKGVEYHFRRCLDKWLPCESGLKKRDSSSFS